MNQHSTEMSLAALILLGTFAVFATGKSPVFRIDRAGAAIVGSTLMIAFGILTFDEATSAVDYKTIAILFNMMIVTANLKLAGFFSVCGDIVLKLVNTRKQLLLAVILGSGVLSALFINDIVCLLFTPVVILICKKLRIDAVPYLIAVATASNIGSAATLVGNPQNILIGSLSGMSFNSYLMIAGPLALAGLGLTYLFISFAYKQAMDGPVHYVPTLKEHHHPVLLRKSLAVAALILLGFFLGVSKVMVTSLGAAFLLVTRRVNPNKVYTSVDFNLLVIFIGLFVIIGGVDKSGLIHLLSRQLGLENVRSFTVFTLITVGLSNLVSNVPAVLLLKFFVPEHNALTWWAGMAVFSTFAGNLTLTGSIANLIVVELAKRENITVSFRQYFRIGFPLTVVTMVLGLLYFSLLYRP